MVMETLRPHSAGAGPANEPVRSESRWGIRRRSVLSAVVVVTFSLLVGGAFLLLVLQSSLISAEWNSLAQRANDVARLLEEEGVRETQSTLAEDRRSSEQVQIIDSTNQVVAASARRLRGEPISALRPAPGKTAKEQLPRVPALGQDDEVLVSARGVEVKDQAYVVLVAEPLEVQTDTLRTVGLLLLAASPLLIALVGVAVWVLVGQSLKTVERIRRQVAEIDGQRLSGRVEVPPTGDEIAALAATMNEMLDKLEHSDTTHRAFFSDASHELRSPLSTLVTTAEVASLDETGKTWLDMQQTVLNESSRMQSLVEDLLTLAKVDAHQLQLDIQEVDLEDVLVSEITRLRTVSSLQISAELQPVRVRADERRLLQVFRNVLDNAARHAQSAIIVGMERRPGEVVVSVDNDGEIISSQDRSRVFERFARLDASRSSDGGGSGLGLAISREIMLAHGGTVVASELNGWCRFEVILPLYL
ncbi:MAG TPA: ATP-binding protein [Propionibacteriaceae bacterium]